MPDHYDRIRDQMDRQTNYGIAFASLLRHLDAVADARARRRGRPRDSLDMEYARRVLRAKREMVASIPWG